MLAEPGWVVFGAAKQVIGLDVGEALIDETREYITWADWLGVPRYTFSAVFWAVIARGGGYREGFQYFDPEFDFEEAWCERLRAGLGECLNANGLYPDVRPRLDSLRSAGNVCRHSW